MLQAVDRHNHHTTLVESALEVLIILADNSMCGREEGGRKKGRKEGREGGSEGRKEGGKERGRRKGGGGRE